MKTTTKAYIAQMTQTAKGLGWEIVKAGKGYRRGAYLVRDRQSGLCRVATTGDFVHADYILAVQAAQGFVDYTPIAY